MSDDNDRIGLSGSTPSGQYVRSAAALSGQSGWRRTAAGVVAWGGLLLIVAGVVVAIVSLTG